MNWVRAKIKWRSPEEGGRSAPPPGPRYSTVARFVQQGSNWRENAWSLVLQFVEDPDQQGSHTANVKYLSDDGPQDWLTSGSRFELWEGSKVVASGEVIAAALANGFASAVDEQLPQSNGIMPGDIVSGLDPSELVEIRKLTPFGSKTLIEAITLETRREIRRPVTSNEMSQLTKVRSEGYAFDGDPETFLLGAEAERIRIAHQFDPLFAVNSSVVDVLPHQVEAVYRYLLPLPRIRFLLADDTGAGKTIMTGLLIKELLFRGTISKVLIITPGGLTRQWQDEMLEKFDLDFERVTRASFDAKPNLFSRQGDSLFVTSIDFISRNEQCLNAAKETQWDLIVVDEAHKLSAYEYGSKVDRGLRYAAVEALEGRTDHLLFLTATPHRGRKDTFRRLLMLLDQDLFQKDEHVSDRIREQVASYTSADSFEGEQNISKARNRFFLRRLKEEMVDWETHPLFKPRHTHTAGYELTPAELDLYNAVTKYVRSRRKQAKEKRNRNVELTLMVMQRRLASSIYAITKTLKNRLASLEGVLRILRDTSKTLAEKKRLLGTSDSDLPRDISEYEEMDDADREAIEKRISRQVLTTDPEEVEKERDEVSDLVSMAEDLKHHNEAKFTELLSVLDTSGVIRQENEKLVIFTEHRDTLDNLTERLTNKGYSVATIHGSMDVDARKEAQREFRNRCKIMIATDAAGEGINLQFCRFLINWDIPWNPNRLEQRMGRIHRYGQEGIVSVYNLVASNTREGAVMQRILTKLDVMREQMGDDRVYDVIQELLEDVPLVKLVEKSIDDESPEAAAEELDSRLGANLNQRAENLIALQKKQSLASRLDLRAARDLRDASEERRLQPLFIKNFFTKAFRTAGGTINEDKHFPVYHVGRTPSVNIDAARRLHLPVADKYDTPFVFDKNLVSVASRIRVPEYTKLLGPGHPLFNAVIEWAIQRSRDTFARGATLIDPNIAKPQQVWLVRSIVNDGRREEKNRKAHEQLSVVIADPLGLRSTSPAYLLTCTTPTEKTQRGELPSKSKDDIQAWAWEHITEEELKKVNDSRKAECDLRRQYLNTTFTDLILDLQSKLNELHQEELLGEEDADERHKLEQRLQLLKERKVARMAELELMLKLTANLPQVLTSATVLPAPVATVETETPHPKAGVPMQRDEEVELFAMNVVMRYERSIGWTPYDVSKDGEHYDIRSEARTGERKYIEVKGRAQSGAVVLTGPEVDKLRQLAERAYLYIVTFCKGEKPRLRIIQDPMSFLSPEMLYRQVQFLVEEDDWMSQGEEIVELPSLN
jgi:superfamily II DNA or RNA helicase